MPDSTLRSTLRHAVMNATFARIDNSKRIRDHATLKPGQLTAASGDGPYYIPGTPLRRDVREDRTGIPLTLRVTVVDAATGLPLDGEVIGEIWHADAHGNYSGYLSYGAERFPALLTMAVRRFQPTDSTRFLRGRQQANPHGVIEFLTIVPGWYTPRTLHIHFKASHNGTALLTTEFYFPDHVHQALHSTPPYGDRPPSTFNNNNDVEIRMTNGSPGSWPHITRDHDGYTATINVQVRPPKNSRTVTAL
jgi:protocatechuate 3,4-dioxygenase beta subunit